jgi:hypothetical protein
VAGGAKVAIESAHSVERVFHHEESPTVAAPSENELRPELIWTVTLLRDAAAKATAPNSLRQSLWLDDQE